MYYTETVLIDMRWTEAMWTEVFVLRLIGWAPRTQLSALLSAGHFLADEGDQQDYRLTANAKSWTDPHGDAEEYTYRQLAETLVFLGLEPSLFDIVPAGAVRLDERDLFDHALREKVLRYLVRAALKG